jgi:hypothetical protein
MSEDTIRLRALIAKTNEQKFADMLAQIATLKPLERSE